MTFFLSLLIFLRVPWAVGAPNLADPIPIELTLSQDDSLRLIGVFLGLFESSTTVNPSTGTIHSMHFFYESPGKGLLIRCNQFAIGPVKFSSSCSIDIDPMKSNSEISISSRSGFVAI